MARGGINKTVVQKARQALLTRGVNPSIDAVRVELGNTGSKTTISRYLKELEAYSPAVAPSSRDRLGDVLSGMVQTLLDQLMEEGKETISEVSAAFALERATLESQILELTTALAKAERHSATQHAALEVQSAELATCQSSLQAELTRNAGLSQRCSDLEVLVVEKDKRIQSLEEKHVQARRALEHYREAAKEQRDQDHRKHESQLHELQVEQRKLRETIAVKQDESTRLNRDNERLLGEARQQAKSLRTQEVLIRSLNIQVESSRQGEAKTAGVAEHLNGQISALREEVKALHKAATVAELQERETAARITSLQNENEHLRHVQGVEPSPKDGSESPHLQGNENTKSSKRPRK